VHERCYLPRENGDPFRTPLGLRISRLNLSNFPETKEGKVAQKLVDICISGIEPELIERIRRRSARIEPNGTTFSFPKLGAVSLGDQRQSKTKSAAAMETPYQVDTAGNISPLVRPADLQGAIVSLVELGKIQRLQDHVTELGK